MKFDRRTAKISRQHLRVKDGALGAPISMQVALTDSCFNRCIMCDHPNRPQRSISPDAWINFLDFIYETRRPEYPGPGALESVCYSGGDPMAYPDFNRVMEWHIEHESAFGCTITGYVPPHIDIALLARAAWVRVSLDAVTPDVYARVRGRTPVKKVIDGIDTMISAGVNVCLGITVHGDNLADIPNVMAFAEQRGITDIDQRHIYPGSAIHAPDWHRDIEPFRHCHASLFQLYIDADGSVYPCCITAGDTMAAPQAAALGNFAAERWDEIWARVVAYSRRELEELPSVCRTCCVQRLSEINNVVDAIEAEWPDKYRNFF